jgi:hypothetical protein
MTAVRINLCRDHHNDNPQLRPFVEYVHPTMATGHLSIHFGRRGRIKVKACVGDLRAIAKELNRLADAVLVANGSKSVAP